MAIGPPKIMVAGRVLIPLLDILQSIPVLAFLPGLLLALDAAFPANNIGLELAATLMIFTGQAWNMTFSFYHSLRSIPQDQHDAATAYRFTWWQRLKWVELPFSTMGLVWNSMMSMAGGWFFLMITETYQLGDKDFRLPGIGSYMKVAVDEGRVDAMLWAMLAMLLMIVALDQLLWRPVVVWAQKFRVEEGGEAPVMSSWFLNWLRRSRLLRWTQRIVTRVFHKDRPTVAVDKKPIKPTPTANGSNWGTAVSIAAFAILLLLLAFGAWKLTKLLAEVPAKDWGAPSWRPSLRSFACWCRRPSARCGRCRPGWPSACRRGFRAFFSRSCRSPRRFRRRCCFRWSSPCWNWRASRWIGAASCSCSWARSGTFCSM